MPAFTTAYDGLTNVIQNDIGISNPSNNRFINIPISQPSLTVKGVWDTGASSSCISKQVAQTLGLVPTSKTIISTANGEFETNVYIVDLWLPNRVMVTDIAVVEADMNSTQLLIGMDVISLGDFTISSYQNKTTLSFRMPSKEKTDYVVLAHTPVVSNKAQSRNSLCSCGSGKKYKHCCDLASR